MLDRSGAPEPEFLPHVMLRVCDLMQTHFPVVEMDDDLIIGFDEPSYAARFARNAAPPKRAARNARG